MASTEPRFRIIELVLVKPGPVPNQYIALTDAERSAMPKGQPFMVLGDLSALSNLASPQTQLKVLLRKDDATLDAIATGPLMVAAGQCGLVGSPSAFDFVITINPPPGPPPEFPALSFFLQVYYYFPAGSTVPLSTECITGKFV